MNTRRGFLGALLGGAAAFALDPERALWVPGKKTISIPAVNLHDEFLRQYVWPAAISLARETDRLAAEYYWAAFARFEAARDRRVSRTIRGLRHLGKAAFALDGNA